MLSDESTGLDHDWIRDQYYEEFNNTVSDGIIIESRLLGNARVISRRRLREEEGII